MYQVRNGVFETNSSSTHSICIPKKHVDAGAYVDFHIGEYGWDYDDVDAADYLYTAILCFDDWRELLDRLKEALDCHGVSYTFEKPEWNDECEDYLVNGWIDHAYDTREFVEAVLDDDDLLMRLLFGDSHVYTGNDNDDMAGKCLSAKTTVWTYDGNEIPNPDHDEDFYDYFFKAN